MGVGGVGLLCTGLGRIWICCFSFAEATAIKTRISRINSTTWSLKARGGLARKQKRILWLLGVSRWFTNCQTNCLRASIFFFLVFLRWLWERCREIYYSGEREEQRRSRCRRASSRRRSSPEIYGCQAFTAALCARVRYQESVRAI